MRHAFNQKGINSLFQKLDAHYTPCSRIETLYHQYLFKKRMFHKIFFIFIIKKNHLDLDLNWISYSLQPILIKLYTLVAPHRLMFCWIENFDLLLFFFNLNFKFKANLLQIAANPIET